MSHSRELGKDGNSSPSDANVIQLGFNISVVGESASDFEIFVNDKKQTCGQLSSLNVPQIMPLVSDFQDQNVASKGKSAEQAFAEKPDDLRGSSDIEFSSGSHTGEILTNPSYEGKRENIEKISKYQDFTIIDELKNAMGNFDKFSERLKEIPRFSTNGMCTSSPYPVKSSSQSKKNPFLSGNAPRALIPRHDFRDRKYFKKSKQVSNNIFLKPLPAEDYFKKGFLRRYQGIDSYRHYTALDNPPMLYEYEAENKSKEYKLENGNLAFSCCEIDVNSADDNTIKKDCRNDGVDKHSTSSDSVKDIKIYQSGGIIIMQNINENSDLADKSDSAKLIENCSKITEKVEKSLLGSEDSQKHLLNSSSDEIKMPNGKFVQFDLSSCEISGSKSLDSSLENQIDDDNNHVAKRCMQSNSSKVLDKKSSTSGFQSEEYTALDAHENDSVHSNIPGMSPTSSTSGKKLEWDSGADVGYLNVDLAKEEISTIERIILKGLGDDGVSKKQIVYEKAEDATPNPSKLILQIVPSNIIMEEVQGSNGIIESKKIYSNEISVKSALAESNASDTNESVSLYVENKKDGSEESTKKLSKIWNEKKNQSKNIPNVNVKENLEIVCSKNGNCSDLLQKVKKSTEGDHIEQKASNNNIIAKKCGSSTFLDKSTYVNTLFEETRVDLPLLDISISDESCRSKLSNKINICPSSRVKKYKKKKSVNQGQSLIAFLGDKIDTKIHIPRFSSRSDDKSKGYIKGIEPSEFNEDREPFIQRGRHKANGYSGSEKNNAALNEMLGSSGKLNYSDSEEQPCIQSYPIFTSFDSVNKNFDCENSTPRGISETVHDEKKFSDQMIQTNELNFESKGIQVLEGPTQTVNFQENMGKSTTQAVDDVSGSSIIKNRSSTPRMLYSSKSVQAPGMTYSLPKHLTHPKISKFLDDKNTKGTQFFGMLGTSLPNYHSSTSMKGVQMAKLKLKNNRNADTENNRVKGEYEKNMVIRNIKEQEFNVKNIVDIENDITPKITDKSLKKNNTGSKISKNDEENKENFFSEDTDVTQNFKNTFSAKESKDGSQKCESIVFGSCDVQFSDDSNNVFLTSDILKGHGYSIDRNFLQEKYFESQLKELGRRKMISRSTSMQRKESEKDTQASYSLNIGTSVACQCSPKFREWCERSTKNTKKMETKRIDELSDINLTSQNSHTWDSENEYNKASHNTFERNSSFSTNTQTSHSRMHEINDISPELDSAVEHTHSFEYLPNARMRDHLNLEEKSMFGKESDILVVESYPSYNSAASLSESLIKKSEGGETVVLENSYRAPLESDRIKSLDENLTDLEVVVSKLNAKEAFFQKITQSMLSAVTKCNGAGDISYKPGYDSGSKHASLGVEEISCEIEFSENKFELNGSKQGMNEISTACQTDILAPNSQYLYEEKKHLEQMNEEKEQQIKWIEDEINQLNILRSLLEKQEDDKHSTQRRKRHHYLTDTCKDGVLKENFLKNILTESLQQDVITVNNPENSTLDGGELKENSAVNRVKDLLELPFTSKECTQFGMSLSLRKGRKKQEVTMLPVGVQVTLRDTKSRRKTSDVSSSSNRRGDDTVSLRISENHGCKNQPSMPSSVDIEKKQTDSGIQNPILRSEYASHMSFGKGSSCRCSCEKCNKNQCMCLKSSENSINKRRSLQNTSGIGHQVSGSSSQECSPSNIRLQDTDEFTNWKQTSSDSPARSFELHSGESSIPERSRLDSEVLNSLERCVCKCHAQPLPRCGSCNLLNTCKKCQCYKRIKCCLCRGVSNGGSLNKRCVSVNSCECEGKVMVCRKCRCSKIDNQMCALCPCHLKPTDPKFNDEKVYEERSSQTEGKTCMCCELLNNKKGEYKNEYRETKYMSEELHTTENRNPTTMILPSENRYEMEEKKSVEQKYSFHLKVPLENKKHSEMKNAVELKTEVANRCPSSQKFDVKEIKERGVCLCNKVRQYFLQVEETTEEETSESYNNGNSLEVITIRVPVKKVCKSGLYAKSSPQRSNVKTEPEGQFGNVYRGNVFSNQSSQSCKPCKCCGGRTESKQNEEFYRNRPKTTDEQYKDNYHVKECQKHVAQCRAQEPFSGNSEDFNTKEKMLKRNERQRSYLSVCDSYNNRKYGNTYEICSCECDPVNVKENSCNGCVDFSTVTSKSNSLSLNDDERASEISSECICDLDCPGRSNCANADYHSMKVAPKQYPPYKNVDKNKIEDIESSVEGQKPLGELRSNQPSPKNTEKSTVKKNKTGKCKKDSPTRSPKKSSGSKSCQPHSNSKLKTAKTSLGKENCKGSEFYNFNKKEYMTKSEIEKEKKVERPTRLTLQECLTVKRPDLYARAECRRKIISEKTKDRIDRHNKRMECLSKHLQQCDASANKPNLRLFTTAQMKKQTKKFYKNLPEVTNKAAQEKKIAMFRTNKLMAEIFAKKLQLQTLSGCVNLSNSFSVMSKP